MQHVAIFDEQVVLTPKDMRTDIGSIDQILLDVLSGSLDGKCSRHGFVLPGTLKIMSRSMGALDKGRFTGNILFLVKAEAEVLNPPDGTIIEGEVIRKNKMGIYVSYQDAIRIILPRDLYIGDASYDAVQIGETIKVEVKKSRFQVNDPYILSVGYFRGRLEGAKAVVPIADAEPEAEAEETEEAEEAEEAEAEAEAEDAETEGELEQNDELE
jgi:DNA-directed RNA polymerase subunit E'/Rpb7